MTNQSSKAVPLKWRAEPRYHISHSNHITGGNQWVTMPEKYLASACNYGNVSRLTRKLYSVAIRCYQWKHIGDPWPHRLPSKPGSDNGTITGQRGRFLTTSSADRNSDWAPGQALLWSTVHSRWKREMNRWEKRRLFLHSHICPFTIHQVAVKH